MSKLNTDEKRIEELENGLREILQLKNIETIKGIAADLVGEDVMDDWLEEGEIDLDNDVILDEAFFEEEGYYD